METQYKIIYSGRLLSGFVFDDVVSNLVSSTSMDFEKAQKFLSVSKTTLVKKDLTREQADKLYALLEKAGVEVKIVSLQEDQKNVDTPSSTAEITRNRVVEPAETNHENLYASPRAHLKVDKTTTEDWLGKPQKVASSHGWHWLKEAIGMFLVQPWKWVGMTLVIALILIPINMIPIVGFIPYTILSMIFGGGLMLAAQRQSEGKDVEFSYIFKGFTCNRNQLIVTSLLYLGGFLVIGLIMAMLMGTGIWAMMGVGSSDPEAASAAMLQHMPMFFLAMLIGLALSIPLMMAMWFATPLVVINDQRAWTACKLSLQGCLKNWLPFLMYGLVFFIISVIIMAVIGGTMGLLAYFIGGESSIFLTILPFVAMVIIAFPLMIITGLSIFTGYRDIFYTNS